MKSFLILVFLSYASSDKLDLTYLPPPGSQYAGGRPEDIQTPLEFPKATYPTNIRQQSTFGPETTNLDDYKLTIGNDRGLPQPIQNNFSQGPKETLNNYPSSYKAPSTTTSYAFTQTTTYPPSESYETTISPINPITGRLISDNFNVPSQEPGQVYQDSFIPIRPNAFGDQQTVNQFGSSQPTLTSSPGSVASFPGSISPSQAPNGQIYVEQNIPGQPQLQQNFQQSNFVRIPGMASQLPFEQSQSPRNYSSSSSYLNQPGFSSSTVIPQGIVSSPLSETMYGGNVISSQNLAGATPDTFQNNVLNQRPNIFRPDTKVVDTQNQYPSAVQDSQQQYPGYSGSEFEGVQGVTGNNLLKPNQQLSTASASSLGNQQFPPGTTRPGIQNLDYKAPSKQGDVASTVYNYRPERPLAEADRNAVILNYTNVITPEGFAYSFDTSNGIHADESGTATDGVKAKGSYSYTGDDGKVYTVVYTADENGFQPHGDHLPTPPPIPEAIQRVIEKVRKEEEAGIFHDGHYDDKKYGDKMYRRPVSRYPQGSNKLIKNGADIQHQDEDDFDFSQDDFRKPSQFQSGLKRPSGSESATFNDDFSGSQNGQNEDKLRKPASGTSNLRPDNRNLGQASLASDDYDEADFQKKQPFLKVSSERPTTDNEDEYPPDTLKESNIRERVNTRRPTGSKATAQYPIEKDTFKQTEAKDNQFVTKDSFRRPNIQQTTEQSEYDQTPSSIDSNSYLRNYNNEKGIIRRPLDGVKNENVDTNYGIRQDGLRRPIDKFSSEHSTDHSVIDKDGFEIPTPYDRNGNVNKDTGGIRKYLPTKYLEEEKEKTEYTDDYGVTSEAPTYQPRPGGVNRPVVKVSQGDRIVSTKRRPARPGIRVDENVTEENNGSIDDISEVADVDDDSYSTPGYQVTNDGYKVSQKFKSPDVQQISNRPTTKYSGPRDELQGTSQLTRADEQFIDNVNPQYGQKLKNRPTNIPSTGLVENKERFEQLSNNTGYMYIPPRNRLNYYEGSKKIPTQSTSVAPFSTTRKPSYQTTNFQNKEGTVKPFMTLNVKRVDNKYPEEEYEEEITPDNEELPYKQRYEDLNRDINVQYTTPDQIFSDEVVSTTRPLMQSSVKPTYQTSRIPQYNNRQYYNENTSAQPLQPSQETFIRKDLSSKTPFGRVPSTTPLSSPQKPTYYSTTPQGVIIPGQQNVYNTEGDIVQRIPNNNVPYSTTPLPSEGQYNEQYYNEKPSARPLQPSQETFIRKNSFTKTPFGRVPSTTSLPSSRRPAYYETTPQDVLIPGQQNVYSTEGNFVQKLPSAAYPTTPLPSAVQSTDRSYPDGDKGQYQTTYSYRPTYPSIGYTDGKLASRLPAAGPTYGPTVGPTVGSNGVTESVKYGSRLPTTTYRPYYTTGRDETPFPKPGVQVDGLGRPIVIPDQQGYNQQFVTGTEENTPGIKRPGFEKDVQNYQASTERVLGEDFSGPKQQQRFDPKLGYYY